MNTRSLVPTATALAVLVLSAFSGAPATPREPRPVGAFTEVNLGGAAHVVLRQGSPQSVVVEGSPDALASFATVVTGAQLHLRPRRGQEGMGLWARAERGSVTVYVTAPVLTALRVGGSGELAVEGPLQSDALQLAMAGSGRLRVPQLTAGRLETALAGSGDVVVGGRCPRHDIRISGSGTVRAHDLNTDTSQISISGSGDAHVFASKAAEASISGSGDVRVAGGGQLHSTVRGSGRISQE